MFRLQVPALGDRDPSGRHAGKEIAGAAAVRPQRVQVPVVDPHDRVLERQGAIQFRRIVHLDQGVESQRSRLPMETAQPGVVQAADDQQHRGRSRRPPRPDLRRVHDEVLHEDGEAGGRRSRLQVREGSPEGIRVGQHRNGGGAGLPVRQRPGGGIVVADRPGARTLPLELGDHRQRVPPADRVPEGRGWPLGRAGRRTRREPLRSRRGGPDEPPEHPIGHATFIPVIRMLVST